MGPADLDAATLELAEFRAREQGLGLGAGLPEREQAVAQSRQALLLSGLPG